MQEVNIFGTYAVYHIVVKKFIIYGSKKEYKDQESIQSSTTPDPWESDKKTRKHHIQKGQEVSPFPTGDNKGARNRHGSMAKQT